MSRLGHQEMTNSSCVSHDILHQHCLIFSGHPQALRQGIPSSPPVCSAHITHVKIPPPPVTPKVFLTFSPFSLSICSRWSFYVVALQPAQLSRSPFSPARPTKRRVSHPTSPPHATLFFSLMCAGSPAWRGVEHTSQTSWATHPGLGEDGLSLGLLGRHHRTLLAVPAESELLDKHKTRVAGYNRRR